MQATERMDAGCVNWIGVVQGRQSARVMVQGSALCTQTGEAGRTLTMTLSVDESTEARNPFSALEPCEGVPFQRTAESWSQWHADNLLLPCPGPYAPAGSNPPIQSAFYHPHGSFYIDLHQHSTPHHTGLQPKEPQSPSLYCSKLTHNHEIHLFPPHSPLTKSSIPVPGDFFGLGHWSPALFVPTSGELLVYLGPSKDSFTQRIQKIFKSRGSSISSTVSMQEYSIRDGDDSLHVRLLFRTGAQPGDVPLPRCYLQPQSHSTPSSSDSRAPTPRTQFALYHTENSSFTIFTDLLSPSSTISIPFGHSRDIPVPADYLGKGVSQIAQYRPTTGEWFILHDLDAYAHCTILKATSLVDPGEDVPLPFSLYNRTLPAIWKPHENTLYICYSLTDWTLGTGAVFKLTDAEWSDIALVIPHSYSQTNICFVKDSDEWIMNHVSKLTNDPLEGGRPQRDSSNSMHDFRHFSFSTAEHSASDSHSISNRHSIQHDHKSDDEYESVQRHEDQRHNSTTSEALSHIEEAASESNSYAEVDTEDDSSSFCYIQEEDTQQFLSVAPDTRLTLSTSKECKFEWVDRIKLRHVDSGKFITAKGCMLLLDANASDSFLLLGGSCLRHEDGGFVEVTANGDVLIGRQGSNFVFHKAAV